MVGSAPTSLVNGFPPLTLIQGGMFSGASDAGIQGINALASLPGKLSDAYAYMRDEFLQSPFAGERLQRKRGLARTEKLIRSFALGSPFALLNALTRWEVHGRQHIQSALRMRERDGRGIVFIPRHVTFFDDPFIYMGIGNMLLFTVETKFWWSTASKGNFYPSGSDFKSRFTRYFSDVSNMIYFSRAKERNGSLPEVHSDPHDYIAKRLSPEGMGRLGMLAAARDMDVRAYLGSWLTQDGEGGIMDYAAINQIGVMEALAKAQSGGAINLFPEGTRSRRKQGLDVEKKLTPGTGKIGYFADNAVFVPIYFEGMRHILPIGSQIPKPFKRVVVSIGEPILPRAFAEFREREPTRETFLGVAQFIMSKIEAHRPFVLEQYYGAEEASRILREEEREAAEQRATASWRASGEAYVQEG